MSDPDPHPDLIFRHLDPRADDGHDGRLLRAYAQSVSRGFHEQRLGDETLRRWLEALRAEKQSVARGAWASETAVGDGLMPVATFSGWDGTINVGDGGTLPVRMITDVSVAPTHRRRGLLRRLMTVDLEDAAARGVPLAALTVSEGAIYGQFGFGPSHRTREVEVDVRAGFRLHPPAGEEVPGGRLELAEPLDAWPAVRSVFARYLAGQRGEVDRPSFHEPILTGVFDPEEQEPDTKLRAVVHLDAAGEADGYALYKNVDDTEQVLRVSHLQGLEPAVELRLWRFLAEMDLVNRLQVPRLPVVHPLDHAVVDPRRVRTTKLGDLLWLAVLDVPTALESRPWGEDGSVVLGVDDPLGISAGRWRVTVEDGAPTVERTDDEPGVRMRSDVLGSLYLGGVDVGTLADAGRVAGDRGAVATFAAMADVGPAPFCTTGF